jgi:predicted Zn-dependent protease
MKFAKLVLLVGVATLPASAVAQKKSDGLPAPQAITAKDRDYGAKAHTQLVQEFGGAYEGPQADYVRRVGQRIAVQSGLSNTQSDFTVTLLNSSVDNAFAVPGGYVYVTRQLLALMNDEAELASVMGHEVGHVAARHSQSRQKRATTGAIGQVLAGVLGQVLGGSTGARIGQQLGGSIAQNYVLSFSRSQEYQADDLGVSYLGKAGYDPMAASTMLASLAAGTALTRRVTNGKEQSARASTHPDPASRVTRAAQKARVTPAVQKARNRDVFLNAIDGMMYDDDPKQGVIDGQGFRHPELRIAFTAPAGYAFVNTPQAVLVNGPSGQAQFTGRAHNGDLRSYISSVFQGLVGQGSINIGPVERGTVNGLEAARASALANTQQGQVLVTVQAYEMSPTTAFHFIALTPPNNPGLFQPLFQSFRRLSAAEATAIKPRRVDVITAKAGDTVASLSAKMAYGDYREDRFRTLNALGPNGIVRAGERYKLIVY